MIVNFEFLGNEPIENVITCMNFQIDKVVYFGYQDVIEKYRGMTGSFLKKYCGTDRVEFYAVPEDDLQAVLQQMRVSIEAEQKQQNRIFFDITGGESLILVAFGMLAAEYRLPMHIFDVKENHLIELEDGTEASLVSCAAPRTFHMDLDKYIEMRGGRINYDLQKDMKSRGAEMNAEDIRKLWDISEKYEEWWNAFSEFLRRYFTPDENLVVRRKAGTVLKGVCESTSSLNDPDALRQILEDLERAGILSDLIISTEYYEFRIKNETMKDILWDGGSILELHVMQEEKKVSADCRAGVHLDWDGEIRWPFETDVMNEIDVLSIRGNVPTFISCKSGRLSQMQTLRALYELHAVADRFGGKYAGKVLAVRCEIGRTYKVRAEEMGIEIRVISNSNSKLEAV